ncbi:MULTISPECIES: hypothetical protein [Geobacillus]|uniref:Uncharacterized protein n=1 Tax=Geobacillus zalihae TaxID=213419 RepID=A0A7H1RSN9_9BACL|nr:MULTISPECIES: hypothetical protein [Geobacillus]EPR27036.1 hypothetical protein I656_03331 [Geobacillus sp. WSUCF1]OQP15802.1 hypothetical protein B1693_11595 [Geobacillus zalihae]OQP25019.1 hypothetical protein B1694_01480 [Geobacillus zalihae]QNU17278.1 hypothetical protein IC807_12735 [Geobacillus zalihae]
MAKKMLGKGYDIDAIHALTGLPFKKIERMKEQTFLRNPIFPLSSTPNRAKTPGDRRQCSFASKSYNHQVRILLTEYLKRDTLETAERGKA